MSTDSLIGFMIGGAGVVVWILLIVAAVFGIIFGLIPAVFHWCCLVGWETFVDKAAKAKAKEYAEALVAQEAARRAAPRPEPVAWRVTSPSYPLNPEYFTRQSDADLSRRARDGAVVQPLYLREDR